MNMEFKKTYMVPLESGAIEVDFIVEYEVYGWDKHDGGQVDVIDVTSGAFKYISNGDGTFGKVPLTHQEQKDVDNWLALTPLWTFEEDAYDDVRSIKPEPRQLDIDFNGRHIAYD